MASDSRIDDLLGRYPDDLTDAELAELRAASAADPALDDALDALLLTEAILEDPDLDLSPELSPPRQRTLDTRLRAVRAWTLGPAAPTEASTNDAPKAWTLGPAAPTEAHVNNVVDFSARRRARMVTLAIAAAILVALGFAARGWFSSPPKSGYDPYGGGTKGDDDESAPAIQGQILIQGAVRVQDGDFQRLTDPVNFTMRLENGASIALVEVRNDTTIVVWPPPGIQWFATVGHNPLMPPGSDGSYRAAAVGEARYVLVASTSELAVDSREISTIEAFIEANGALVLDTVTVNWIEGEPLE